MDTARKILLLNDNLRKELAILVWGKGKISLGMPFERAGYMLSKVVGILRRRYPGWNCVCRRSKVDNLVEMLLRDEIDFFLLQRQRQSSSRAENRENLQRGTSSGNASGDGYRRNDSSGHGGMVDMGPA